MITLKYVLKKLKMIDYWFHLWYFIVETHVSVFILVK